MSLIDSIIETDKSIWSQVENTCLPLRLENASTVDKVQKTAFQIFSGIALFAAGICVSTITLACRLFRLIKDGSNSTPLPDPNLDFSAVCADSREWEKIEITDDSLTFDKNLQESEPLWGFATCEYQGSGSTNCPDSQWVDWEKKVLAEPNRSGKSAELIHKTDEVIKVLKETGANSYRFSVEWSLIEPEEGKFNDVALQHYVELCEKLRDNGITPMLTLHHFSEPKWFFEKGSFANEANIASFVDYTKKVFTTLEPYVDLWCTINEPAIEAFSRYVLGSFGPGKNMSFGEAGKFLKSMLKAHVAVYKALKALPSTRDHKIGFSHNVLQFQTSTYSPFLFMVERYFNRLTHQATMDVFSKGVFELKIPFLANDREEIADAPDCLDFLGVQYYTRPVVGLTGSTSYHEPMTKMPFREDPQGIYEALVDVNEQLSTQEKKIPIYVTEFGISTDDPEQRNRYFERAIYAMNRAKADKDVNLKGVFAWTLVDNLEWDLGMNPQRFGACKVDNDGAYALKPGTEALKRAIQLNTQKNIPEKEQKVQ